MRSSIWWNTGTAITPAMNAMTSPAVDTDAPDAGTEGEVIPGLPLKAVAGGCFPASTDPAPGRGDCSTFLSWAGPEQFTRGGTKEPISGRGVRGKCAVALRCNGATSWTLGSPCRWMA